LIQCQVSGLPEPEVTWRHGGKRVNVSGL